jgi:hypothetical protein
VSGIPKATALILRDDERSELYGLARSTKSKHRMRQRAPIPAAGLNAQ